MLKIGENVLVRANVEEEIRTKEGIKYKIVNKKGAGLFQSMILPESELQIDEEMNQAEIEADIKREVDER